MPQRNDKTHVPYYIQAVQIIALPKLYIILNNVGRFFTGEKKTSIMTLIYKNYLGQT